MSANKLAIVPKQSPIVPPPSKNWFTRARDGALVFHGETFDDHVAAWGDAQNTIDGGLWGQAMVAASLETKYRAHGVEEFAKKVGRSAGWIWDMARAYRVFQFSSQLENVSFTHHVEAAKADSAEEAVEALAKAFEKGWTTKQLQGYVETGIEPELKAKRGAKDSTPPELAKLHDEAVRNELTTKIAGIQEWPDSATDPLLAAVYRRMKALLEWQRDRTVEKDCAAIMEIFTAEEGMELPDCVSLNYIMAWLNLRGRLMKKSEVIARIDVLKRLRMLTDFSRTTSKGPTQRGVVTPVYAPIDDYMAKLEDVAFLPDSTARKSELHADFIARAEKYAPELLPEKEAEAA